MFGLGEGVWCLGWVKGWGERGGVFGMGEGVGCLGGVKGWGVRDG